jgi:hypothetical protein
MVSGELSFGSTLWIDVEGGWNGVEYLKSGRTVAIAEMAMPETGGRGRRG